VASGFDGGECGSETWAPRHKAFSITLDTYPRAIPAMPEEAAALIAGLVLAG